MIIDFAGVDGAGKGSTVNMLNTWMDPRFLRSIGYREPTEEEHARPRFWRYWRDLPPKGRIGLYLSGRYSRPLMGRVYGGVDELEFDRRLAEIIRFENALTDDGALILKFWMHLSREQQEARFEELSDDTLRSYRVTDDDRRNHKRYDDFVSAAEQIITRTNRGGAPWNIVEGADPKYRHLRVGEIIAAELSRHLDGQERRVAAANGAATAVRVEAVVKHQPTVFDGLDLLPRAFRGPTTRRS